jgi:hypothetical protein
VAGVILVIKAVFFWVDHTPMMYLGDSTAYMCTATMGWIPPDRSFVYGLVIRKIAVGTGSLTVLLAAQTLASAVAAMCCAVIVRRHFGAQPWVAAAAGVLCAVEPLQLLYERYVMTEALSLGFFAVFMTLALEYLKRPRVAWIVLMQVAGVLAISFRVSFLPAVTLATAVLPLLAVRGNGRGWAAVRGFGQAVAGQWRRVMVHFLVAWVLFFTLHGAYRREYAERIEPILPGAAPAYNYENGLFLLTFVAPIVERQDFPDPAKADEVFGYLPYDLRDYRNRSHQRWQEGGLVRNVMAAYPDPLEANRVAAQTAWNAMRRDPLGELRLAATSWADYWDRERLRAFMAADRGNRDLPPELLEILRYYFGIRGEGLPYLSTVTNRYFFAAWPWYLAVLLAPLPAAAMVWRAQRAGWVREGLLLGGFATLQVVNISVLTAEPTVRFLHAIAWATVVMGGAVAGLAFTRGRE